MALTADPTANAPRRNPAVRHEWANQMENRNFDGVGLKPWDGVGPNPDGPVRTPDPEYPWVKAQKELRDNFDGMALTPSPDKPNVPVDVTVKEPWDTGKHGSEDPFNFPGASETSSSDPRSRCRQTPRGSPGQRRLRGIFSSGDRTKGGVPSRVPSVDARAPRARRRARRGSSGLRRGVIKTRQSADADSSLPPATRPVHRHASPRARSASRLGPLRPPFFLFFILLLLLLPLFLFLLAPRALASAYSNVTGAAPVDSARSPPAERIRRARSTSTVRAVASLRLSTCKMALLDLEFSRISRSLGRCASSISSAQSAGFDAADDASGLFSESHRASGASARAASNWR